MTLIKKITLAVIAGISTIATAQALTTKEFYNQCAQMSGCTKINIPESILHLENPKIHELRVVNSVDLDRTARQNVLSQLEEIEVNPDTMVVKDSEDGETNRVFIEPNGDKVNLLVTRITKGGLQAVFICCDKEILHEVIDSPTVDQLIQSHDK